MQERWIPEDPGLSFDYLEATEEQPRMREKADVLRGRMDTFDERTRVFLAKNFKNTELGLIRIRKNLKLLAMSDGEIVAHCRAIILSVPVDAVTTRGKNFYLRSEEYAALLTINRSSLGIITAARYSHSSMKTNA